MAYVTCGTVIPPVTLHSAHTPATRSGTHLYLSVAEGSPAPVHRDGYSVDVRELAQEALVHVHRQALRERHTASNNITSYHIICGHIASYHIVSHHTPGNIISLHIISYQMSSQHIISYQMSSHHIISYHIISYYIVSDQITSYQLWSHAKHDSISARGAMIPTPWSTLDQSDGIDSWAVGPTWYARRNVTLPGGSHIEVCCLIYYWGP